MQATCDRALPPMQTLQNEILSASVLGLLAAMRHMMMHMLAQVDRYPRQGAVLEIMFLHCEKNPEMDFINHEKQKHRECLAKLEALVV